MAADNTVTQAAAATTGAVKSAAGFVVGRVNPFKASGLWATAGASALFVGGAWAIAPVAMANTVAGVGGATAAAGAAGATTGAAGTATASANVTAGSIATSAWTQLTSAMSVTAKGAGTIVTQANWGQFMTGVKTAGTALTTTAGSSAGAAAGATGAGATTGAAGAAAGAALPPSVPAGFS